MTDEYMNRFSRFFFVQQKTDKLMLFEYIASSHIEFIQITKKKYEILI